MKPHTSIYLDGLRFGSAMLVLIGHVGLNAISGGVFWQLTNLGSAGVIVFFVLSGFVISHVTLQRERSWQAYTIARLSRMYSVVVPAIMLTIALDSLRHALFPKFVIFEASATADYGVRAWISLLFLNEAWSWHVQLGSNGAYWSLSYEVAYYAMFGIVWFGRTRAKWVALAAIMLLAGPGIVALLPAWLFGVAAHRLCTMISVERRLDGRHLAGSLVVLLAYLFWCARFGVLSRPNGVVHYGLVEALQIDVLALLFAVHIVCFDAAAVGQRWLKRCERPIRATAGTTFGLYLFHMPILTFLAAWLGSNVGAWRLGLVLAAGTVLTSAALAVLVEPLKRPLAHVLTAQRQTRRALPPV